MYLGNLLNVFVHPLAFTISQRLSSFEMDVLESYLLTLKIIVEAPTGGMVVTIDSHMA